VFFFGKAKKTIYVFIEKVSRHFVRFFEIPGIFIFWEQPELEVLDTKKMEVVIDLLVMLEHNT